MQDESLNYSSSIDESLSALADGEASEIELRRILKELDSDPAAYERKTKAWKRLHTIGALIRKEPEPVFNMDISSRVSAVIADEPNLKSSANTQSKGWMQAIGKTGVAAAIAVGVLVGVQQIPTTDNAPSEIYAENSTVLPVSALAGAQAPDWFQAEPISARAASVTGGQQKLDNSKASVRKNGSQTIKQIDPEVQKYLDMTFKLHAQNAATVNSLKVVPLARAASKEVK